MEHSCNGPAAFICPCHMKDVGIDQPSHACCKDLFPMGRVIFQFSVLHVEKLHFLMPVPGYKTSGLLAAYIFMQLHKGGNIGKFR